jgi:diguanylate cyclase (GGDEF)-like protein
MGLATFLCRNEAERGRLVDVRVRLNSIEPLAAALLAVVAMSGVGTFGPGPILAGAVALLALVFVRSQFDRLQRPELLLAGSFVFTQAMIAAAAITAYNGIEYILPLFALPVTLLAAEYPRRVVAVGWLFTCGLVLAVAYGFAWSEVLAKPPILLVPWGASLVLAISCSVVRDVDAESRATVVMDRLTGVLNRAALGPRLAELAHQASVTGGRVAVIIGDVDHFKLINDRFGHATGDEVLKEIAQRLRRCVGSFEPIYRFGGEEFMVMIGGCDLDGGRELAETMRQAVGGEAVMSLPLTMSFGVSASEPGQPFDFEAVFGAADAALYRAKRGGRDRVTAARLESGPQERENRPSAAAAASPLTAGPATASLDTPALGSWRNRLAREHAETGSLLVRDELEREHLLDLARRLRRVFRQCAALVFLFILISGPWVGWLVLIPPIIGAIIYSSAEYSIDRVKRPEYVLAISWMILQTSFAMGFALATAPCLFALILFAPMVVGTAAVQPNMRAVVAGVLFTLALITAAGFANAPDVILANPAALLAPLTSVVTVALIGWAIGQSAIDHRGASVVDPLTGLLNRNALEARTVELEIQAAATGEPVSVIVCDIDHFKRVNDEHGHVAGDIVLREATYRIRQCLRAFESAYRFGGEEFVVLLPGVELEETARIAERIAHAVRSEPLDGISLTLSIGVASSAGGERFEYARTFQRADAALLAAKRAGRDRVEVAGGGQPVAV